MPAALSAEKGWRHSNSMFVCEYLPNVTCTTRCICDFDPEEQASCQCLPRPTTGNVERQLELTFRVKYNLVQLSTQAYSAVEAAATHLMTYASTRMSVPARVTFWDMVARHATV